MGQCFGLETIPNARMHNLCTATLAMQTLISHRSVIESITVDSTRKGRSTGAGLLPH